MAKKARKEWQHSLKLLLARVQCGAGQCSKLSGPEKKKLLWKIADELLRSQKKIQSENKKDLKQAEKNGLSSAMIDRLTLNPQRIQAMAKGVRTVANLPDPIGRVMGSWKRPNGLQIRRLSVPIGVILIIYESRPNVTVECASLALKSGNGVILRGGKEAFYSNRILVSIFKKVLKRFALSEDIVSFITTTDRQAVDFLLKRDQDIQLVIPRGGESLIRKVARLSRIPVIKHYQGICHVYLDQYADVKKAIAIALNAKMQRTGVCNAMETLLVHKKIAPAVLPRLGLLYHQAGCEMRADESARRHIPLAKKAKPSDFGREFLDKIVAIKTVGSIDDAIAHIGRYGSGHTEAIVSKNSKALTQFLSEVDSSSVMANASTRFSDGFEYGFGAEIGISTDKIHARGPMGLEGLTSYKYIVQGNGQIRT